MPEVRITENLAVRESEFRFTFTTSGGPGGQNVNRVSTRVTLTFDVAESPSLSERQRARILERLRTRINRNGVLRVVSQRHRTQGANREAAVERFVGLLREALAERRPRKKTRVPGSAVEARLSGKRKRGLLKRERCRPASTEE